MQFKNRITEMLGVEIPVVQAPMGWIARSQLASAVSKPAVWGSSKRLPGNSTPSVKKSGKCVSSRTSRLA